MKIILYSENSIRGGEEVVMPKRFERNGREPEDIANHLVFEGTPDELAETCRDLFLPPGGRFVVSEAYDRRCARSIAKAIFSTNGENPLKCICRTIDEEGYECGFVQDIDERCKKCGTAEPLQRL